MKEIKITDKDRKYMEESLMNIGSSKPISFEEVEKKMNDEYLIELGKDTTDVLVKNNYEKHISTENAIEEYLQLHESLNKHIKKTLLWKKEAKITKTTLVETTTLSGQTKVELKIVSINTYIKKD